MVIRMICVLFMYLYNTSTCTGIIIHISTRIIHTYKFEPKEKGAISNPQSIFYKSTIGYPWYLGKRDKKKKKSESETKPIIIEDMYYIRRKKNLE